MFERISNLVLSFWNGTGSAILTSIIVFALTVIIYKVVAFINQVRILKQWFKNAPGPTDKHWFYGHLHLVSV
jgi:hypothetical protein